VKYFDAGTIIVIILTATLFAVALFVKGFTHDLLLEAGVLLVSVKLIMMAYKNAAGFRDIKKDLDEIRELLKRK
jgi:cobalamin biosynthesis protein CobD/CbiB